MYLYNIGVRSSIRFIDIFFQSAAAPGHYITLYYIGRYLIVCGSENINRLRRLSAYSIKNIVIIIPRKHCV